MNVFTIIQGNFRRFYHVGPPLFIFSFFSFFFTHDRRKNKYLVASAAQIRYDRLCSTTVSKKSSKPTTMDETESCIVSKKE